MKSRRAGLAHSLGEVSVELATPPSVGRVKSESVQPGEGPSPAFHPGERPPESSAGWLAKLNHIAQRYRGAVAGLMMGACSLPGIVGAPSTAHAQSRRDESAATATAVAEGPPLAPRDPGELPSLSLTTTPDATHGLVYDSSGWATLNTTLSDGRRVNLLPTRTEMLRWLDSGQLGPTPRGTAPVPPTMRTDRALDALLVGVPSSVREQPWTASFDDYFRARAAVSEVPTALAGMALEPVANGLYRIVDHIPAPIRRPFDRSLGILLDNAVSIPANLLTSRVLVDAGPLPPSAALDLPAYPQIRNSCGETMVATWLKGHGVPIALGEVDTQTSFFEGTNLLEDAELRNRGFSIISGPGTMTDLKTYLAHGYPVMVSIGWPNGGGHYAVVTGYDDASRTLTIDSYNADGAVTRVPYSEFQENWGRHLNLMTVAHPQRDARLSALRQAGRISRTAQIQEGLSLSDIWVTQRLELFVEAAYRYRGTHDDLTVRLNVMTSESRYSTADMFGGSVRYSHRFDDGTRIDFYAERLPIKGPTDGGSLETVLRNTAVYVGAQHGPFGGRAGYERGVFQAQLQAELNRRLFSLGAEARVTVGPDGTFGVFLGAAGRF